MHLDDNNFELSLSVSIVDFMLEKANEFGKGPGHALIALETTTVGLIAIAAHDASKWESIASELAKNVQERLFKLRAMHQKASN